MASTGSSSVLGSCRYARGFLQMPIRHTPVSFLLTRSYLKALVMISAKAGRAFSRVRASNDDERGL